MRTVVSKQNPALKAARKLAAKRGRDKSGAFLVTGRKLIEEALAAGFELETLFINANAQKGMPAFAETIEKQFGPDRVVKVDEKLYNELAGTVTPQPLLAMMRGRSVKTDVLAPGEDSPGSILILDRISDPGNAGTMIRTAFAAGIDAAWCVRGTTDLFSDKTIRTSAGAVFHMPAVEGLSAENCIERVRKSGKKLIVLAAGGSDLFEEDLFGSCAFVVGNEGSGADAVFTDAADAVVGIPMDGRTESLNAATAVAILLYEKMRRERGTGINEGGKS